MTSTTPQPPRRSIPIGSAPPKAADKAAEREALRAKYEAMPWRMEMLNAAPHRLGFFLAMVLLFVFSGWWAWVQIARVAGLFQPSYAIPPTLLHSAMMVLGFMPLYFAGFLFTAGPKWLHVEAPETRQVRGMMLMQAGGWLLWLMGGQGLYGLAIAGAIIALLGLAWMFAYWWKLVRSSKVKDQVHARTVGIAGIIGCISLIGMIVSLLMDNVPTALLWVQTGLWGFILFVFVAVAHRMIPFFTSNVLPLIEVWRPFWVLWLMLGAAGFEILALWLQAFGIQGTTWLVVRGVVEIVLGGMLLWLAVVWGLAQSLKIRLLAMLHIGFVWLGITFVLFGLTQFAALRHGQGALLLAPLHALTMGCLGSLVVAMVTRVSCGHSGRTLVADDTVWRLFLLLQVAVVLRLAGAFPGLSALLPLAAAAWFGIVLIWGNRLVPWYGKPRVDGKEG